MDQQKLRSLVFDKTGVKIDIDDPIFALVALNEAVLAEAVERHVALLDAATDTLAGQVDALRDGGALPARATAAPYATPAASPSRASAPADADPPMHAHTSASAPAQAPASASPNGLTRDDQRSMLIAAGAAVLGAILVLCGQALWFKPAPAVAPQLVAKELTVAQTLALRDADKLARAVQKLDPKARAAVQAELQKP